MHKRPLSLARLRTVPHQFSWVEQRLVQARSSDQRSPEACALSLCLVTVAAAPGLSFSADRSLCTRLSMTPAVRGQARQTLVTCALVASQSPLYQVLALDRDALRPAAARPAPPGDDDPVDLKAVFKQIWEVLA